MNAQQIGWSPWARVKANSGPIVLGLEQGCQDHVSRQLIKQETVQEDCMRVLHGLSNSRNQYL